tara:strand:+ start:47 stop:667 length:621 start_codon:yes stop_codon:yes gene_type:complete
MDIKSLPHKISIFPLSNVIFFPYTILPLNIFEKRYLQMIDDSMKNNRLFGMIQNKSRNEVYKVGCLGKIINFNETIDKRYIISLSGVARFKIKKELKTNKLYREFNVDYTDYTSDFDLKNDFKPIENKLIKKIKSYFDKNDIAIKFSDLGKLNSQQLIDTLCMICPFSTQEKQKLIEIIKIEDRIKILEEIISFDLFSYTTNKTIQ